jgi:hypothetical protein
MGWWATTFKSPRAKRIWKWIDRAGYPVTLAAFIFFQFPWKVTAIYAISLAPHLFNTSASFRKWDGRIRLALFAVFLVWLIIPWKKDGYVPFRFSEEIAAMEQQRFLLPDQNSYPIYDKLFHAFDPNDNVLPDWAEKDIQSFTKRVWTSAENPKLSEWLDHKQSLVAELKQILRFDHCRFPLEFRIEESIDTKERYRYLKIWYRILNLTANRHAGNGDIPKAIETYGILSKLGNDQFEQPVMIHHLLGMVSQITTCTGVMILAVQTQPTPEQLNDMEKLLDTMTIPGPEHWDRLMQYENMCFKNEFCGGMYEINNTDRIRFSRSSLDKLMGKEIRIAPIRSVGVKFGVALAWVFLPDHPSSFAQSMDKEFAKFIRISQPDLDPTAFLKEIRPRIRFNYTCPLQYLMTTLAPAYIKVADLNRRCQAICHGTHIVIALRRYKDGTGHWPESLSELHGKISPDLMIDPSNGGEFVYRREGESFRFYSKGKNGIDDAGLRDKKTKTDDYLYWPIESSPDSGSKTEKPLHPDANPS